MNRASTTSVSRAASSRRRGLTRRSRVERQLLAEEEILGGQARVGAHAEREPVQEDHRAEQGRCEASPKGR